MSNKLVSIMLQLYVRTSQCENDRKMVCINRNTTIGGLKKYLESVFLIPSTKQIIKRCDTFNNGYILDQHDSLKCIDLGLSNESLLEILGPTLVTQHDYDISDFKLQFSDQTTIPLMPRCAILWKEADCPEHELDTCHLCNGTNKINVPLYCPFTPIINKISVSHDYMATFEIQGNINNTYDLSKRRGNYELVIIPAEFPDEKNIRIMVNDCGLGLSFITCKMNDEEGNVVRNTQFKVVIETTQNLLCRICNGAIFHGELEHSLMTWGWACEGCHCILHPKCAIDTFTQAGSVQCGCIACVQLDNTLPQPIVNENHQHTLIEIAQEPDEPPPLIPFDYGNGSESSDSDIDYFG